MAVCMGLRVGVRACRPEVPERRGTAQRAGPVASPRYLRWTRAAVTVTNLVQTRHSTKCTRVPAYCLPEPRQCHGIDATNRHLVRRGLGASQPATTPKGRIPPEPVFRDERLTAARRERSTVTRRERSKRSAPCAHNWRTVLGEERILGQDHQTAYRTLATLGDRCGAKPNVSPRIGRREKTQPK